MDRVAGLNWTDIGAGKRGFRGRDAASGLAGTEVTAAWLNAIQEELAYIAGLSGAPLDPLKWTQVAEGIRCGRLNYIAAGGTGAAYVAPMTPAPASYARLAGGIYQLVPPVENTGPVTLAVGGLSALPLVRHDGAALRRGDLQAGRPVLVVLLDTLAAWQVVGWLPSFSKKKLEANLDLYINASTGNDSNPGTLAAPFRTLQAGADYLQQRVDLNGYAVRLFCTGAFTAGVGVSGQIVGQASPESVRYELGSSTVTVAAGYAVWTNLAGQIMVVGGTLSGRGAGVGQGCAISVDGGRVVYRDTTFGTCDVAHVRTAYGGVASCQGGITITGGAPAHLWSTGDLIDVTNATVNLVGTPAFSAAFALANGGKIAAYQAAFSGAATGKRYSADVWGSIYVGGAGPNVFPGTIAGTVTAQGDYR